MADFEGLLADADRELDLTDPEQEDRCTALAEALLATSSNSEELQALEVRHRALDSPLAAQLAIKVARSRKLIEELEGPVHISVVFAAYKEHRRILQKHQDPLGEDFLRRKAAQLRRLVSGRSDATWDLRLVDDGCPEGTGRIAQDIISEAGLQDSVRVLSLGDAIEADLPIVRPLQSPSESQKGGSILYGMWDAAREPRPGHVIVFTDADLSTHLGQLGMIADPILRGGALAAIGSRREELSVVVKKGARNTRGKLFIYLWKRLLARLDYLIDTQCGFKGFRADRVTELVTGVAERRFAFDIELLLRTDLRARKSITKVGVAWIDSEAASTTTDLQPYLPMLKAIAQMYRTYLPQEPGADAFAGFIEGLDDDAWSSLLEEIPAEIASRHPAEFGTYAGVSVADLQRTTRRSMQR